VGTSNTHDADHWPLQNRHFAGANFGNALKCRCRDNRQRCHAANGYLTPLLYEQALKTNEIFCPEKC